MTVPPLLAWLGRSLVPLAFGVFVIAFYRDIQALPDDAIRYPNVVIAVTLSVVLINLAAETVMPAIQRRRAESSDAAESVGAAPRFPALPTVARPLAVILLVAAFAWFTPRAGFYPSAVVFLFGVTFALGTRRPLTLAATSLGIGFAAFVLFDVLLGVSLPAGRWWA